MKVDREHIRAVAADFLNRPGALKPLPMSKLPTVMGIPRVWTGCEVYRLEIPFRALAKHGWDVFIAPLRVERHPRGEDAHIIVLPRFIPDQEFEEVIAGVIRFYRSQGRKVIFEADDDLSNRYRKTQEGDWGRVLKAVDAVTVTNSHLAALVKEHNPNVYIIPNHIDFSYFTGHTRKDPRLTVGLQGGASHYEDWKMVEGPLRRIKREFPEVRILIMGYEPDYLKGLSDEPFSFSPYRQFVASLVEIDIGLCPLLTNDKFNNSKTPVKALEYWAAHRIVNGKDAGAAVIASNHVVYRRAVNKGNGLLAEPDQWYDAIKELILNRELRERLQVKGHAWVKENANIQKGWKLWADCYLEVWKK